MITYALFKKRIDEHLAVDEHWAGLDARTLGRSESDAAARTRGRVRVRALGPLYKPQGHLALI